mmetsp:Transcript_110948/g.318758  ORF Transcript_110948/g.318758 Transcript_110948/m.318758 type:complete len:514 (-) Transcript_110948:26-1567(-)
MGKLAAPMAVVAVALGALLAPLEARRGLASGGPRDASDPGHWADSAPKTAASLLERSRASGQATFPASRAAELGLHAAAVVSQGAALAPTWPSASQAAAAPSGRSPLAAGKTRRLGALGATALRFGPYEDGEEEEEELRKIRRRESLEKDLVHYAVAPGGGFGADEKPSLAIPREWAAKFRGPLRPVGGEAYMVALAGDANVKVKLRRLDLAGAETRREFAAFRRIGAFSDLGQCHGGHVAIPLDTRAVGSAVFHLLDPRGTSLADKMAQLHTNNRDHVEWELLTHQAIRKAPPRTMPPEDALPLVIDVLRGVRDLEQASLLHGALTPDAVVCARGRAVVAGLDAACAMQDGDPDLHCEVTNGTPTGPENHVWSVALILAEMLLGYNPVERAVVTGQSDEVRLDVGDAGERRLVRELIRDHWWGIEFDSKFASLEPDVQLFLCDALNEVAALRPTTEEALARAVKMAESRGMSVPAPRERPRLPDAWAAPEPPAARSAGVSPHSFDDVEDAWQ